MKNKNKFLWIGLVLISSQVWGDQVTYDALVKVGLPLSTEHGQALIAAEGTQLLKVVAEIQATFPASIVQITAAAASAAPANAAAYAAQAITLVPKHSEAIIHAAVAAAPEYAEVIHAVTQTEPRTEPQGESNAAVTPGTNNDGSLSGIPISGGGGGSASRN